MKERKSLLIFIVAFLLVELFCYYALNTLVSCPIHFIFHVYCPGCGVTRMFICIIHLDFYQAFLYNQFVFILLFLYFFKIIIEVIRKKKIIISEKAYIVIIVIALLFGIIRNIPYFSKFFNL